jgi:light-regulated signal transduction histidine kinase (bacteriophytochrome)
MDKGIGFHPDYAEKIFTIFQTLNEKNSFGGYGIGLARCREIRSTHTGIIYATGSTEEGASYLRYSRNNAKNSLLIAK